MLSDRALLCKHLHLHNKMRLLQKSTISQSCLQDCLDFAERMKRKALRVRSEGSIPPYVTEAESRKQHSDSPLCNSLKMATFALREVPIETFRRSISTIKGGIMGLYTSSV